MASEHKRVFISYAWEAPGYRRRVKGLAARLRQDGVDVRLDAWDLDGLTIPEFMAREVRHADKILILCSPKYRSKVHAMEDGQAVTGSGWESMLVTSALWTQYRKRNQLVAVLFLGKWSEAAPGYLAGWPYIDLTDLSEFESRYYELLRNLTGMSERAPSLGPPPVMSVLVTEPLRGTAQASAILVSDARVPRQLPPPPADFVGRAVETDTLLKAVRRKAASLIGLRGIGGIGKTALALVVADNLAADFPVGQIYLDLKGAMHKDDGADTRPLGTAQAMDHVIRSFNPSAPIATSDADREGQYRSTLNGNRILLLMDNARDIQQVERLIPPAGCLMLVTAREHFTLAGMLALDLPILNRDHACDLLLKIAPSLGHHVDELAKLCAYIPEALRTAASALANAPDLDPGDFVRRMRVSHERLRLTGVELSLTTSSELLGEHVRNRWFQLGVFPAAFDEYAASAIWQISNIDGKNLLASLRRYSLVEFDSKHRRYYLHDLVRDFVLSRCPAFALELARLRHAKYYTDVLEAADYVYGWWSPAVPLALEMFDAERINIEAGQRWASARRIESRAAAKLCLRYSAAGVKVIPLRLNEPDQIAWFRAGEESVQFLSEPRPDRREVFESEVMVLEALANVYLRRGKFATVEELLERSFNRREDLHLVFGAISPSTGFGDLLRATGKRKKALAVHLEIRAYLEIAKEMPRLFHFSSPEELGQAECRILESLGDDYLAFQDGDRAIKFFSAQLRLAKNRGDRHTEMRALGRLGVAHHLLRRYGDSIDFQERARAIAEELADRQGQADALYNLAISKWAMGDRTDGIELGETACAIYKHIKSRAANEAEMLLERWRRNSARRPRPKSGGLARARKQLLIPARSQSARVR